MIGFVSALSSSLAIIILIMSVMMLNMIISAQSQQEVINEFTINEEEQKNPEEKQEEQQEDEGMFQIKSSLISAAEIEKLSEIPSLKTIILHCDYGYTFDYNSAMKLTAFNSIAITKNILEVEVKILKPVLQESKNNTCFVKYEKHNQ